MKRVFIVLLLLAAAAAAWYFWLRPPTDGVGSYIGTSPDECSRLQFICVQGMERFDDAQGCGCREIR